jgi:hypothetical protein
MLCSLVATPSSLWNDRPSKNTEDQHAPRRPRLSGIVHLSTASGIALLVALTLPADVGAQASAPSPIPAHADHVVRGQLAAAGQPDSETNGIATSVDDAYQQCIDWSARAGKLAAEMKRTRRAINAATGEKRNRLLRKLKQLHKKRRKASRQAAYWCERAKR